MLEILLKSIKAGARIIEVPMILRSDLRKDKTKMKIGKTIRLMIHDYRNKNNFWNKVLNHKRILSDAEAESITEIIKESRKEKGFRE